MVVVNDFAEERQLDVENELQISEHIHALLMQVCSRMEFVWVMVQYYGTRQEMWLQLDVLYSKEVVIRS